MALSLDFVLEMSAIPFKEKEQNEKPFSCSVCQRCFSGVGFLKAHFQRAHHKSPFPLLPLNDNKSGSIKAHKSHSIIASKEKSLYSCDLCSKTFPRKLDLIKHEFMHRSKHGFPHIHIHHQSANSLNCSACNSHFIYKKDFKNHVSTKCEMCCKVICRNWFSTKSICKSEKECNICKRDLCEDCHKLHQTTTIIKEEYECIVCKMNFTEKRCLKDHYARTHSIVKLTY